MNMVLRKESYIPVVTPLSQANIVLRDDRLHLPVALIEAVDHVADRDERQAQVETHARKLRNESFLQRFIDLKG